MEELNFMDLSINELMEIYKLLEEYLSKLDKDINEAKGVLND